jgi:hypothetical protein
MEMELSRIGRHSRQSYSPAYLLHGQPPQILQARVTVTADNRTGGAKLLQLLQHHKVVLWEHRVVAKVLYEERMSLVLTQRLWLAVADTGLGAGLR